MSKENLHSKSNAIPFDLKSSFTHRLNTKVVWSSFTRNCQRICTQLLPFLFAPVVLNRLLCCCRKTAYKCTQPTPEQKVHSLIAYTCLNYLQPFR